MKETELLEIYRLWLKKGDVMTDWGLLEWLGKNYTLTKIESKKS